MPDPEQTKRKACRPARGDKGATHDGPPDCRPPVAPTEATPAPLQSLQMARGVAPVTPVAPWRTFDPVAHRADIARILGEAPDDDQLDAHVSDWADRQERAAIIEFDGERSRREAERLAEMR